MAIAFVQYDDYLQNTGATTIANNTALNTTSGNFIAVAVGCYGNGITVASIADTAGNTYQKAIGASRTVGSTERTEIWYAENITGNANNITTVTYSASVGYRYISVSEYSGVSLSSSLLDSSSNVNVSVAFHTSGNSTSENTGDLIIGGYHGVNLRNITVGAGFTTLSSDVTSIYEFAEYKVLGAAGDYPAECTTSAGDNSIMVGAIFSVAGGAPPVTSTAPQSNLSLMGVG